VCDQRPGPTSGALAGPPSQRPVRSDFVVGGHSSPAEPGASRARESSASGHLAVRSGHRDCARATGSVHEGRPRRPGQQMVSVPEQVSACANLPAGRRPSSRGLPRSGAGRQAPVSLGESATACCRRSLDFDHLWWSHEHVSWSRPSRVRLAGRRVHECWWRFACSNPATRASCRASSPFRCPQCRGRWLDSSGMHWWPAGSSAALASTC